MTQVSTTHGSVATADESRAALEVLLAEPIDTARHREAATFEEASGSRSSSIVLFGAGGLGRRTLAGLRAAGVEPKAFADNRPTLWGTQIDGVDVLSPTDAAERFAKTAVFVVTIWGAGSSHRLAQSVDQLQGLGCDLVLPAAWLHWHYAEQLLPFYALELPSKLLEQSDDVRRCFELLADDQSREEFVAQVQWRLTGDPGHLSHPVAGAQYLVDDVATSNSEEVVLDCGAYDGDTLRSWLDVRGPSFKKYFAMEPDPISRGRMEASIARLDPDVAARVQVLPYSVSNYTGIATFSAMGTLSSSIGEGEGITVQCIRLDDLEKEFGDDTPTFLKVDVEGTELDTLEGGADFLRRARPLITIASYHIQDHLWKVPLAIHELWSGYQLYFRPHNEEGWDLILYAVPADRVIPH
jgi:FkbM family methyltransferase